MVVDKDAVTSVLRAQGEHDRALQAEIVLPRTVNTRLDAGTLHQLGLNVADVEAVAAGSSARTGSPTESQTGAGADPAG